MLLDNARVSIYYGCIKLEKLHMRKEHDFLRRFSQKKPMHIFVRWHSEFL